MDTRKLKNANYLILDTPLIDWFTVTAFDGHSWDYWTSALKINDIEEMGDPTKQEQYTGFYHKVPSGSLWLGSGEQKGRMHNIIRASGEVSNSLFGMLAGRPRVNGWAKVTRLDLQVTVKEPGDWSQWRLFNRLMKDGKNPEWRGKKTNGVTVYVGSRVSNRFTRIYQKPLHGGAWALRFEVEFKAERANKMALALEESRDTIGEYMLHELQLINDPGLTELFYPCLSSYDPKSVKIRRVRSDSSTGKWLLGQVLPALDRYINDHDHAGEVLLAFHKVVSDRIGRGDLPSGITLTEEANEQ